MIRVIRRFAPSFARTLVRAPARAFAPQAAALCLALALGLSGLAALGLPHPAQATAYFSTIDDLPIPDGMTEQTDQGVVFDAPTGRIVTVVAQGRTTIAAVHTYYRQALPELGWTPIPDNDGDSYVREGQTLTIDYAASGGDVTARIRVVPTGAAAGKGATGAGSTGNQEGK